MNGLNARVRRWLVWLLPFLALSLAHRVGSGLGPPMAARAGDRRAVVVPQPVVVAVLPEYKPAETLATPARYCGPVVVQPNPQARTGRRRRREEAPPARPQFVLTGTLIIDGKATAFLRENTGGKSRRVAQGDQVNGMLVTDVKPDRIKLTLGDESEDLVLKVAAGPKTTTQPVTAPLQRPPPPARVAARRRPPGRPPLTS